MDETIHILHLEDDLRDAEYFAEELRVSGLECRITLAQTKEEFGACLNAGGFDLILSDNTLPGYDGLSALSLARTLRPDLPFIFLSGSIGEEAAIETLKNGATDYVLKSRKARLISAIRRALKEAADRRDRERAEAALRESEERYALAAIGANDGLWDWDLKRNVIHFSARWNAMLGASDEEIGTDPEKWFQRIHPADVDRFRQSIEGHLKGAGAKLECEYRIRARQGAYIWVLCRGMAVRDAEGKPYRMAGSQGDITERKRAEEKLLYDAFHDSLTGLYNRNLFLNHLQKLLWMGRRREVQAFSIFILGLDRFSGVNGSLGRQTADLILREAARRLEAKLRPGDTLARLGGDEFAVLVEGAENPAETIRIVQDMQDAIRAPFRARDQEVFLAASAGIAHGSADYQAPEEVLRDAEIALVKAKAQGGSGCVVFEGGMHAHAMALHTLERDLRRAIERNEFRVHYQPIVRLDSGELAGFEALVRWLHPSRGWVQPLEFIPFAEEIQLIHAIGKTVLEQACRTMKAWQGRQDGRRDLTVSVNLSGKQFRQRDLIRQIGAVLQATELDPKCLKLEITETSIMDDPEAAADTLLAIRDCGIGLQIDDFGTGYSSLAYLQKFPVQALKIDRSFVHRIGPAGENAQIAATITTLAHNLGMQVVAEGIETPDNLRYLKGIGCEFGQGYLFAKPLDESAAGEWRAPQGGEA